MQRARFPFASAFVAGAQTIPAFPGAEGAGAFARGGRGGDVYHVTNTNASGPGSLAYGLTTGVPSAGRTIVFDVSGYAHVASELRVVSSKITIAGQTAPGDGFGLKDGTFRISGDDIVIRHLRFRAGHTADAIDLDSGSINSILDHCDAMFGGDENFSSYNSPPENMTFQWGLNAWGLESHSCGGLWDQNHATARYTLWAHNHTRNPKARPSVLDWTNNVTFDWDIGFIMGDSETPASWKANVRGNYFICPPGNIRSRALEKAHLDRNGVPNFSIFVADNLFDKDGDAVLNGQDYGYGIASGSFTTLTAPASNSGTASPVDPPLTAYKKIVSAAGPLRLSADASQPLRDEVGTILVQNLVTLRRHHISRVSQTGAINGGFGTLLSTTAPADTDRDGMPDFWEAALGLNAGADEHNGVLSAAQLTASFFPSGTAAGYTWLEEYLHFRAIPHGVVAKRTASDGGPNDTFLDINLRRFTSGFSKTPVFTFSAVSGGTVSLRPDGFTARFVPALNTFGRGKFSFTVTDADGSTWTQQCGVLISASGIPRDLLWQGDSSQNQWNATAPNWLAKSTATAFSAGDHTLFNDTGSAAPAIQIGSALAAGAVVVDTAKNYTFSGAGAVNGAALTKSGTGTLTVSNIGPNSFVSGVTLNAGTLTTTAAGALGTGPLTLAGGSLIFGATLPNPLQVLADSAVSGAGTQQADGAITGSGTLTLGIGNNATLTHTNTMAGFTGTLSLGASGANAPAYLRLNGNFGSSVATFDLGTGFATLLNRNGNATIRLGALLGGANTTLNGASSVSAPTTYLVGENSASTTFAGGIADNRAGAAKTLLTKAGVGTLTLSGVSTYTGATSVGAGTLAVTGALGDTSITVESGATLQLEGTVGTGGATIRNGGTLAGGGLIASPVTTQSGAVLSPGSGATPAANLRVGNGLVLNSATHRFDLSSTPGGANDRLTLSGGVLEINGTQTFDFRLTDGVLGLGTYVLIDGGTTTFANAPGLVSNLPTSGTRQTFALQRPPANNGQCYIRLVVGGAEPASLLWTGTSGLWDLNRYRKLERRTHTDFLQSRCRDFQ